MIGASEFQEIKKDVEEIILYSQEYPFDIDATPLLEKWLKAKEKFIAGFNGAIKIRSEQKIRVNLSDEERKKRFSDFIAELQEQYPYNAELNNFLKENYTGFFNNRVVKDFPNKNIWKGMKLVKSFKNFLSEKTLIESIQDVASKYIQEDKIEGYLYLSVDPRDFLTLSENNENWVSCHSLDGDYRTGNLSYMVDDTTFIAYIADENRKNLRCIPKYASWYSKKWRMLVHTNLKTNIYYDRQYPYFSQDLLEVVDQKIRSIFFLDKDFTGIMDIGFNKIIQGGKQKILNGNYLYIKGKIIPAENVINTSGYCGYSDLIKSNRYTPLVNVSNPLYSYWLYRYGGEENFLFHKIFDIIIGEEVPCLVCGKHSIERTNRFLCDDCINILNAEEEFYCCCQDCGKHIYGNEESYIFEGETLCKNCYNEAILINDLEE